MVTQFVVRFGVGCVVKCCLMRQTLFHPSVGHELARNERRTIQQTIRLRIEQYWARNRMSKQTESDSDKFKIEYGIFSEPFRSDQMQTTANIPDS